MTATLDDLLVCYVSKNLGVVAVFDALCERALAGQEN